MAIPEGRFLIDVQASDRPLADLCVVVSRLNAKRPFMMVSKVLGKHWPTLPEVLTYTHEALANKIGTIKTPALFLAFAETAIGLGRGVFESYYKKTGQKDILFSQTTRYGLNYPLALKSEEPHSHAPLHFLYEPLGAAELNIFQTAKTLVLIDDEFTTGQTLLNLVEGYLKINPSLNRVVLASLTDWLPAKRENAIKDSLGLRLDFVSLLKGSFQFKPNTLANQRPLDPSIRSTGDLALKDAILKVNYGRLGLTPEKSLALSQLAAAKAKNLAESLWPAREARVLGSGEFLHEPYVLARSLAAYGFKVTFHATTRSPLILGGAIERVLRFPDNYGEGLDNFLYNADPNFPGPTILALETPYPSALTTLLGAREIHF
jgi:hypothetical protein